MCPKPCETCKKEGLPLLLTRYAVFPKDAGAPVLSGNLGDGSLQAIPLDSHTQYGLRLLRSGYVYVYDEAQKNDALTKGWSEYFVTTDGFLTKLPPRSRYICRAGPATEFVCARSGAAPLAGVITIEKPKEAKTVWIGFSDVEWTDAVLEKHNDAAYRAKHMTKIAISGGKVDPQQHTAPIEQIDALVPEFTSKTQAIEKHLKHLTPWTPFQFNARYMRAEAFKTAVQDARPQGGAAIVALLDPAGIAMEIAALMEWRKVTFMSDENVARPKFAASVIASQEIAIKTRAKLEKLYAIEERKILYDRSLEPDLGKQECPSSPWPDPHTKGVREHILWERAQERLEELENSLSTTIPISSLALPKSPSAEQLRNIGDELALQQLADEAWHKYTHRNDGKLRVDVAASKKWLEDHDKALKQFDIERIAPLALAHVAWMQHACMVDQMTCNYDENDKDSGVAYTDMVINLLRYTEDKQPSYNLYLKWLNNGEFDQKNLIMRAIAFNQKELIAHADRAVKEPVIDKRVFPSDAVTSGIASFMEKMPPAAQERFAILLGALSGPMLKHLRDFDAGKANAKTMKVIKALSGGQYVRLTITGDKGQFITAYADMIYKINPEQKWSKTARENLRTAIRRQVNDGNIKGVKINGNQLQWKWDALLDEDTIKLVSAKNLKGQALADELAKAFSSPEDIKKISFDAYHMKINQTQAARSWIGGGAAVVSGILLVWSFSKLVEDAEKSMSHEMAQAKIKLRAGMVAIAGFVGEGAGTILEKMGETRLKNMPPRMLLRASALKILGARATLVTGFIFGVVDIWQGENEAEKGNYGLAFAYRTSAAAGITVSILIYGLSTGAAWAAWLGPIGWVALIIGVVIWFGVIYFIEKNKDNPLQEWFLRCYFGTGNDKYINTKIQAEEYKKVVTG
jgi:hypothetical protein